jgi:hypothetical protein
MHTPRCHPCWGFSSETPTSRVRAKSSQADTPLLITVETPLAPTHVWLIAKLFRATTPGSIQRSRHTGLSPNPSSLGGTLLRLLVPIFAVSNLQLAGL